MLAFGFELQDLVPSILFLEQHLTEFTYELPVALSEGFKDSYEESLSFQTHKPR
jgi:hypothetical protein